ncbi:MAG: type II toxin-antitoxin system HicA family toxin [Immundisolibacter sp.]|nr:type II toxin-antitoxin system HicA family toxin [Immundisolibacter sp.]MDD3651729.1 type II toxin-antitoxin system HicA family toxin [Immundisolibacter sp.]
MAACRWTSRTFPSRRRTRCARSRCEAGSGKDFARLLERKGWELRRVNGSHHIYAKAGSVERISVPIHGNTPLKTGLLRRLMKVAGIGDEDL